MPDSDSDSVTLRYIAALLPASGTTHNPQSGQIRSLRTINHGWVNKLLKPSYGGIAFCKPFLSIEQLQRQASFTKFCFGQLTAAFP
jgi:hypothetical protein